MIGGCTCINGHIEVVDDVLILGFSMVVKSITEKGQYGGAPARTAREWRREIGRIHRLGAMEDRLHELERRAGIKHSATEGDDGDEQSS